MEPIYNIKPLLNIGINTPVKPMQTGVSNVGFPKTGSAQSSGVEFVGASPFSLSGAQIQALAENNSRIMRLMDENNVWNYS